MRCPAYLRSVDRALGAVTGRGLPLDAAPVRFGSWIGGDRDGNPNVTPEVTRKACLLSRWVAADLFLKEIEALRDELSMSRATPELRERVGNAAEPYRELLRGVRDRLRATRAWVEASLQADARRAAARRTSTSMPSRCTSRCGCATTRSSPRATPRSRRAGCSTSCGASPPSA